MSLPNTTEQLDLTYVAYWIKDWRTVQVEEYKLGEDWAADLQAQYGDRLVGAQAISEGEYFAVRDNYNVHSLR